MNELNMFNWVLFKGKDEVNKVDEETANLTEFAEAYMPLHVQIIERNKVIWDEYEKYEDDVRKHDVALEDY